MNFKRKKIRGQNAKTKRTWMDEGGNYRITWSTEIAGIKMESPVIHACVFADWGWGFAGKRGPYKTVKAAKQACEFNKELWDAFLAMEGRDKIAQYNVLRHKSMVGSGKSAVSAMSDIPLWVIGLADERQLSIICPKGKLKGDECDDQSDLTPILKVSDDLSSGQDTGNQSSAPAPSVEAVVAPPVKTRARGRKKTSKPATTKRSKTGKKSAKRSTSTTSSSRTSRKKKEKS